MPPTFLVFLTLGLVCGPIAVASLGWQWGLMVGFDVAALGFLIAVLLIVDRRIEAMRDAAERNDANRVALLAITVVLLVVILVTVATVLGGRGKPSSAAGMLVVSTLVLAWIFSNVVYMLHYAYLYYLPGADGSDRGGLMFPDTPEPNYADFLYFACTLGMTFQTSDVSITSSAVRRTVLVHGLAAFVFNLGALAFTINVLGSG